MTTPQENLQMHLQECVSQIIGHNQGEQGKKQGMNWVLRKNHTLKAGTYYYHLVIVIIADPLQKCVSQIINHNQEEQDKKQGYELGPKKIIRNPYCKFINNIQQNIFLIH